GDEVAVMKNLAVPADRLTNRKALLDTIDKLRHSTDSTDRGGMDTFHGKAFDVLTSSKLVEALDVNREPLAVRDRYGRGSPKHLGDGAPMWNDQLLMARRLVQGGGGGGAPAGRCLGHPRGGCSYPRRDPTRG